MGFKEVSKVLANPMAKEFLTYLRLPNYGQHLGTVPVMRKNIHKLCDIRLNKFGCKKRLLFVVDDLDRCGPKGIVKVFEAVRLVLDIPGVTVIIAIDQRVALAALAFHYQELAEHHQLQSARAIARDYLAKVIHLPITLTDPGPTDVDSYLDYLWQEVGDLNESADGEPEKPINQEPPSSQEVNKPDLTTDQETLQEEIEAIDNTNAIDSETLNELDEKETPNVDKPKLEFEEVEAEEKTGLSPEQKQAFKFWAKYYQLNNPRQLKRLDNCYNIVRDYYKKDTPLAEQSQDLGITIYPLMTALFTLEYLNDLDNRQQAYQIKSAIKNYLATAEENQPELVQSIITLGDEKIAEWLLQIFTQAQKPDEPSLFTMVEPFVLPAIEFDGIENNGDSKPRGIKEGQ